MTQDEKRIVEWLGKQEKETMDFAYRTSFFRKLRLLSSMRQGAKQRGVRLWILAFYTLLGQKIVAACYGHVKAAVERGDHRKD